LEPADQGEKITLRISKPKKDRHGDWKCDFQIQGLGDDEIKAAHGIDSMQAITVAIQAIRAFLTKSGRELTWEGGEKGDIGMPFEIPAYLPLPQRNRIEQVVKEEIDRFVLKHKSKLAKRTIK